MKPDESSAANDAGQFRTTRWSVVLLSAQSEAPGSKEALADLCKLYWYPLYVYVRRRGYNPEDAQDLTQGFFAHLLNRKALGHATPLRGRFRSFLLTSLQNYVADQFDRERALKRGRNIKFIPIDFEDGEERYQSEAIDPLTPEKVFDARWAMTLLGETVRLLRKEYADQGKTAAFDVLEPFLEAGNQNAPPYEHAAASLGISAAAVKAQIHRLRRRYQTLLREQVGRTVTNPESVNEEIHRLCEALMAAEGYLGL